MQYVPVLAPTPFVQHIMEKQRMKKAKVAARGNSQAGLHQRQQANKRKVVSDLATACHTAPQAERLVHVRAAHASQARRRAPCRSSPPQPAVSSPHAKHPAVAWVSVTSFCADTHENANIITQTCEASKAVCEHAPSLWQRLSQMHEQAQGLTEGYQEDLAVR